MPDFDVVVVGAGVCGSAAAIKMAKAGLQVLLVDRGKPIGSKNLSGGVLWGHELDEILPEWWKSPAVERPITTKGVNFLTKDSGFTAQFSTNEWKGDRPNAVTVLRARFDKWLAEQAEAAGVAVVDGVNIQKLSTEKVGIKTVVKGVEQDGAVISANAVVIADGANSRLSIDSGLRQKLDRQHWVLGVKEVIQFPSAEALGERFAIGPNEGVAHEYVMGYMENGAKAGGFLYTNRDTVSLGVVVNLDSMWEKGVYSHKVMEEFRLHPTVAALLRGGEIVEYGAHLIPEGGLHCVPAEISGDGWMIAGDAAGFVYSNGLVIHGMNYAAKSGLLAADAAIAAKAKGDWSASTLARYDAAIDDSFIMKDLKRFASMHEFVWDPYMHEKVPNLVEGIFKSLFTADSQPKEKMEKILLHQIKENDIPLTGLAKLAFKARKSL
ncbi:MAG: FAD-dependent oxidoreductase [Thermoplasmatota archaeon]